MQQSAPDFPLAQPDEETPKTQRNRVTMCGQDTQTRPRRPTAGNARHSPKAELTTPSIGSLKMHLLDRATQILGSVRDLITFNIPSEKCVALEPARTVLRYS